MQANNVSSINADVQSAKIKKSMPTSFSAPRKLREAMEAQYHVDRMRQAKPDDYSFNRWLINLVATHPSINFDMSSITVTTRTRFNSPEEKAKVYAERKAERVEATQLLNKLMAQARKAHSQNDKKSAIEALRESLIQLGIDPDSDD